MSELRNRQKNTSKRNQLLIRIQSVSSSAKTGAVTTMQETTNGYLFGRVSKCQSGGGVKIHPAEPAHTMKSFPFPTHPYSLWLLGSL